MHHSRVSNSVLYLLRSIIFDGDDSSSTSMQFLKLGLLEICFPCLTFLDKAISINYIEFRVTS